MVIIFVLYKLKTKSERYHGRTRRLEKQFRSLRHFSIKQNFIPNTRKIE